MGEVERSNAVGEELDKNTPTSISNKTTEIGGRGKNQYKKKKKRKERQLLPKAEDVHLRLEIASATDLLRCGVRASKSCRTLGNRRVEALRGNGARAAPRCIEKVHKCGRIILFMRRAAPRAPRAGRRA